MMPGHLSHLHSLLFAVALSLSMCWQDVSALLIYHRQLLLDIRGQTLSKHVVEDGTSKPPPLQACWMFSTCRLRYLFPGGYRSTEAALILLTFARWIVLCLRSVSLALFVWL